MNDQEVEALAQRLFAVHEREKSAPHGGACITWADLLDESRTRWLAVAREAMRAPVDDVAVGVEVVVGEARVRMLVDLRLLPTKEDREAYARRLFDAVADVAVKTAPR